MACLQALKQDIKILESTFTKENERFKIVSASVDELTCQFVGNNNEHFNIHANITVRTDTDIKNGKLLLRTCISLTAYRTEAK